MSKVGTHIFALIITVMVILICYGTLRIFGKVEVEELALVIACSALFFSIRNDLKDIEED